MSQGSESDRDSNPGPTTYHGTEGKLLELLKLSCLVCKTEM